MNVYLLLAMQDDESIVGIRYRIHKPMITRSTLENMVKKGEDVNEIRLYRLPIRPMSRWQFPKQIETVYKRSNPVGSKYYPERSWKGAIEYGRSS